MAAYGGRRILRLCSTSARTTLIRPTQPTNSPFSKLCGIAFPSKPTSASPSSLRKLTFSSRLPVELGGALSLIPLHNVTASALFTSLLSLHNDKWGCLSEGFATPL